MSLLQQAIILGNEIKSNWQKVSPGGCKILSEAMGKIDKCRCTLCLVDDLIELVKKGEMGEGRDDHIT